MDNAAQGNPIGMTLYIVAVFIAVALLAVYALRLMARRWTGFGGARHLRLLEQLYLGPQRSVCLIAVPGKVLVLGVAERSVDVLAVIDDPDTVAALQPAAQPLAGTGASFASVLGRLLRRGGDDAGEASAQADSGGTGDSLRTVKPSSALQQGLDRLRALQRGGLDL